MLEKGMLLGNEIIESAVYQGRKPLGTVSVDLEGEEEEFLKILLDG